MIIKVQRRQIYKPSDHQLVAVYARNLQVISVACTNGLVISEAPVAPLALMRLEKRSGLLMSPKNPLSS